MGERYEKGMPPLRVRVAAWGVREGCRHGTPAGVQLMAWLARWGCQAAMAPRRWTVRATAALLMAMTRRKV